MGRDRAGSACQRGDGQRCRSALRITDGQHRIHGGGFHQGHTHDLGNTGGSAHNGIRKICPIKGQNQLTSLCHAHLEQHLVNADIRKVKGAGAGSCDTAAAVGSVLGEADICAGCDGSRIVRRHQRIEVRKIQNTACRTLRTDGAGFANGTLGTNCTGCANGTLRTGGTGFTGRTLRTNCTGCADRALRTGGTGFTGRTLRTNRTHFTYRPLWANRACSANRPLRTSRTGYTRRTLGANRAGLTNRTLRAYRTGYTCRPLGAGGTGYTRRTLGTNSTGFTGRALGTCRSSDTFRSLQTHGPSGSRYALWAGRTSWANGALGALGAWWAINTGVHPLPAAPALLGWISFTGIVIKLLLAISLVIILIPVHNDPSSSHPMTFDRKWHTFGKDNILPPGLHSQHMNGVDFLCLSSKRKTSQTFRFDWFDIHRWY